MIKKGLILIIMILSLFFLPEFMSSAIAQPPPPDPRPIPIDGGLGILLAAGVAYGARKIYLNKEQID